MLAAAGLAPRLAWQFELYGGTVLLAAGASCDAREWPEEPVRSLLRQEAAAGVRDPAVLGGLERSALAHTKGLHDWLVAQRSAGRSVLGYGAASRAVALLRRAEARRALLPAVVDASPAKQGLRMPGTDIPVIAPARLAEHPPAVVLLFLPDLLDEVRAAYPEVEASGGQWADADQLASG
jgi:C-methyltransferase-like protein